MKTDKTTIIHYSEPNTWFIDTNDFLCYSHKFIQKNSKLLYKIEVFAKT